MSMSQPDASALAAIKETIQRIVEDDIKKGGVSYLSDLGSRLGPEARQKLKDLTGQSVAVFVEHEFAAQYSVGKTGPHKNVLVLVRPGQDPEDALRSRKASPAAPKTRSYIPQFWLAFATPPSAAYRYITLDPVGFVDTDESTPPEGAKLIEPEFLRQGGAGYSVADIHSKISGWLSKHGVDGTRFKPTGDTASHEARSRASLLDLMINALDRRQQQSVNLPLDVVVKLMRTHP